MFGLGFGSILRKYLVFYYSVTQMSQKKSLIEEFSNKIFK